MNKSSFRISVNSPVILGFVAVCFAVQLLNTLLGGWPNRVLFSVYRSSFFNPLTYLRCVLHVFGHTGWQHLFGNMMYILILGPMLEEKYGSKTMIFVILAAAAVTGLSTVIFFPKIALTGASSIVFAFILLSSVTSSADGTIPLTFILVAVVYLGQQIFQGLFKADNVAHFAHIIGGIVGTAIGFALR